MKPEMYTRRTLPPIRIHPEELRAAMSAEYEAAVVYLLKRYLAVAPKAQYKSVDYSNGFTSEVLKVKAARNRRKEWAKNWCVRVRHPPRPCVRSQIMHVVWSMVFFSFFNCGGTGYRLAEDCCCGRMSCDIAVL